MSQRTADKNDGYCARCIIDIRNPRPPAPPLLPLSLDELNLRIATQDRDRVLDAVFNRAVIKDFWNYTPGDILVTTVLLLHGETLNGGIQQYFDNPSGYFAHCCGPSLRQIGAAKYADVVERCIRAFTTARDRSDPGWEEDLDTFRKGKNEPFKKLERPMWDYFEADQDELPRLMYEYIVANPKRFSVQEPD